MKLIKENRSTQIYQLEKDDKLLFKWIDYEKRFTVTEEHVGILVVTRVKPTTDGFHSTLTFSITEAKRKLEEQFNPKVSDIIANKSINEHLIRPLEIFPKDVKVLSYFDNTVVGGEQFKELMNEADAIKQYLFELPVWEMVD